MSGAGALSLGYTVVACMALVTAVSTIVVSTEPLPLGWRMVCVLSTQLSLELPLNVAIGFGAKEPKKAVQKAAKA